MGNMHGKVVLVTGGGKAKSIGYGVATAFARAGADLVVTGRNHGKLEAARELEACGVQVLPIQCDGTSDDAVQHAVRASVDEFGRIDVLVNAAQAAKAGVVSELKDADFDFALQMGFYPALRFMRACYPQLKRTKGTVINFASRSGEDGLAGQGSLAVAKAAVEALSRTAASEWRDDGIRVVCLSELVRTGQLEQLAKQYPDAYAHFERQAGPLINPEELGNRCVELVAAR